MTGSRPEAERHGSCSVSVAGCLLALGMLLLGVWVVSWAAAVLGGLR